MTSGTTYQARQLKITPERLNNTLHETCQWGAANRWGDLPTETGMCRLTLSDDDKKVRDWFCEEMRSLGCTVTVDTMGNLFAVRPGKKQGPPTAMGSHLDTQPTGGRYDGILGVMSAVEAMRTIVDAGYETEYPIAVVDWTNEEGARFPKSLHGSDVWSGGCTLETAHALEDVSHPGITAGAELQRIGYAGTTPCSYEANPLGAHFEIHIEQGPVLEAHSERVGVVTGGQAYKWFNIKIQGRDSHAGTTPFDYRADPMMAAARFLLMTHEVARSHGGLATTGIFHAEPGSVNTIANHVNFTLDIRHVNDNVIAEMEKEMRAKAAQVIRTADSRNQCEITWTFLQDNSATHFHPECRAAVKEAALASLPKEQVRELVSGAGHDSCATSRRVPTAMIFVPCAGGLSHNPEEYAAPEDCALGAQVLLDAALLYDSRRKA